MATRRGIVKLLKTEGPMDSAQLAARLKRDADGRAAASVRAAGGEARHRRGTAGPARTAGQVLAPDARGRSPVSRGLRGAERRADRVGAASVRCRRDDAPARCAAPRQQRRLRGADRHRLRLSKRASAAGPGAHRGRLHGGGEARRPAVFSSSRIIARSARPPPRARVSARPSSICSVPCWGLA